MIGEKNGKSFCMFTPVKSSSRQVSTVRLRKKCWRARCAPSSVLLFVIQR